MIVTVALRKTNTICCLTARNDDFLDSQFACSLNYIISAQHVPLETLIIRHQHIPGKSCEVYHGIDGAHRNCSRVTRVGVIIDMEVGSKGIENLTSIREVCLEGVDCGVGKRGQIKIENRVTFGE